MNKFLEEINEQKTALKDTLDFYFAGEGRTELLDIEQLWDTGNYRQIIFTGMGSSYFISCAASDLLCKKGLPAFAFDAAELLHSTHCMVTPQTLLVMISQSGESYEIVHLLNKLQSEKNFNITILGITNEEQSTLATKCTHCLPTKAGTEEMTSTKSFVSTYLVLNLFVHALTHQACRNETLQETLNEVGVQLSKTDYLQSEIIQTLKGGTFIQNIARGSLIAVAQQSALMFMEVVKQPSSALLGGEFRHGPLEMVGPKFVGIVFEHSKTNTYTQSTRLINDILKFEGKVIFITDRKSGIKNDNLLEINIGCTDPDWFLIPAIIPVQHLVNMLAMEQSIIPGSFSHATKITQVE